MELPGVGAAAANPAEKVECPPRPLDQSLEEFANSASQPASTWASSRELIEVALGVGVSEAHGENNCKDVSIQLSFAQELEDSLLHK